MPPGIQAGSAARVSCWVLGTGHLPLLPLLERGGCFREASVARSQEAARHGGLRVSGQAVEQLLERISFRFVQRQLLLYCTIRGIQGKAGRRCITAFVLTLRRRAAAVYAK